MADPKPRKYSARVKLEFTGARKARYLKSQAAAVTLFRAINERLVRQGQPPREAQLEPVRGWEGLLDPCQLKVSTSGAVIVQRPARHDDFRAVAPMWPVGQA